MKQNVEVKFLLKAKCLKFPLNGPIDSLRNWLQFANFLCCSYWRFSFMPNFGTYLMLKRKISSVNKIKSVCVSKPMISLIETFVKLNGQKRNLNEFFFRRIILVSKGKNLKRVSSSSKSNDVCGVTEINPFCLSQFCFQLKLFSKKCLFFLNEECQLHLFEKSDRN